MSNYEWNESEHERTGGPSHNPDAIGVPLQEQVEQVEDALQKAIAVIEAFVEQEKELRNDVYQAQLDAQDWQNKYNHMVSDYLDVRKVLDVEWSAIPIPAAVIQILGDLRRHKTRISVLEDQLAEFEEMRSRVWSLTHQNTELEVALEKAQNSSYEYVPAKLLNELESLSIRNERQATRIAKARAGIVTAVEAIDGLADF